MGFAKIRNQTAAEWTAENPILEVNEIGREFDLNGASQVGNLKWKIGDGITRWASLDYAVDPTVVSQAITNGVTNKAPSEDVVFDALALKANLASPTFTGTPVGVMITKMVTFTENATNTLHTGTVVIPAGSILHSIQVQSSVLWTATTAVMKVGDSVDDDGYFTGVDLKATDLLIGEVLDTRDGDCWGGKEGVYLTAAGRRGAVATNFGTYLGAGTSIIGVITVGTPATTAGRTFMAVTYSSGTTSAAVASA